MRLIDLEPEWIMRDGRQIGLRFICPINDGAGPHREGHSVCVLFANPLDGGPPHPNDDTVPGNNGGNRWTITGETILEMISLAPSIDCTSGERCDKPEHSTCSHTHCWHGSITNGEAR